MLSLALLALAAPAHATTFYQGTVQGGVAVDASGVSTPYSGSSTWFSGPDLEVEIPATATVTEAFVVLNGKSSGLPSRAASQVEVNGVTLTAGVLVDSGTVYQVYDIDPATFGITAAGSFGYREMGSADSGRFSGVGVGGATLYVVYEDATLTGGRHITLGSQTLSATTAGQTITATGLPTSGTYGEALVSVSVGWECSNEQDGSIWVDGVLMSSGVGGRDDSGTPSGTCASNWNSLHTSGSFGFDGASDAWVGVAGDEPTTEPSGGTSVNSRLSDELWQVAYADSGSLDITYSTTSPDSWVPSYALVIELDQDSDGVRDADDDCVSVYDPSQSDADGDGEGDACDACTDVDGDGYGDPAYAANTCADDCDDTDPSVTVGDTYWADTDGDGFGDAASTTTECTLPSGYAENADDCDDSAAGTYPGADEWCDGVDTDCDGTLDEDDALDAATWYADTDGDGYGDAASTDVECSQPSGFVADDTDCDDSAAGTYPGADEWCDGVDTDCDGILDEDDALDAATWYADTDGDGYGDASSTDIECSQPSGFVADDTDCDDSAAGTYPGADEWCDGVDTDCDGTLDEDDALDAATWWLDADADGYGDASTTDIDCSEPSGFTDNDDDCDDGAATVYPGAPEVPYDGIDQDCDGDDVCDVDGDGFDSVDCPDGDDCDDGDADINPDAAETWYDGVDADCDDASDYDADGDGFDSLSYGGEDCDDADADTYPGAPDEPYDGEITDCDGADENDVDGDGFDSDAHGGEDCDDANSDINPDGSETWYDGIDQDCDGNDDDQDGDGYSVDEDCDDTDAESFPGNGDLDEDCAPVEDVNVDTGGLSEGSEGADGKYSGGGMGSCGGSQALGVFGGLALLFGLRRRRESDVRAD
jgi:hypothetical protein